MTEFDPKQPLMANANDIETAAQARISYRYQDLT
jgi:hypothetical protein